MISNCSHDENGKYHGGAAGDQKGNEWQIVPWYNRPWNVVLHHPDARVRNVIAEYAEDAAKNNNIGYDQNQRTTFWQQLEKCNYKPSSIKVKCEADCSSGVAAIIKAVGYTLNVAELKAVSKDAYTGNLKAVLKKAGFSVLTAEKYRTSDKYLNRGDILLYENHHTAINVTDGSKVKGGSGDEKHSVVKKGNKGADTLLCQQMLNKLGYTDENGKKLEEDASCGAHTVAAIKKFQKANALEVDGSCGPATWDALEKAASSKKPSEEAKKVKVKTLLNCRSGAGADYKVISVLAKGDVYTATKEQNGWLYLKEKSGWINKNFVDFI